MKQADSSLLFPLLMTALERCVSPRVYTPFWKSLHIWRYKDILSRKSSHKDTSISVKFWTFLLEKLINSVDPHGNTKISSGPSSAAAEIIVENICQYAYYLNKSLQGFVQRKLDKFEIKLTLFIIICNCGTYNCHFPFVWCFNRNEYK